MTTEMPRTTIRIDDKTLAKLTKIAEYELRPIGMQIRFALIQWVEEYEQKHGEIKLD